MIRLLTFLLFFVSSCAVWEKVYPPEQVVDEDDDMVVKLNEKFMLKHQEAESKLNDFNWLTDDCDGMIWNGKAAVVVKDINLHAAEYPNEAGKWGRRPPNPFWCYENGQDLGSASTWSGDMFKAGLLPYAWLTKDLQLLETHAEYGRSHYWIMGEPKSDWRVVYKPALYGILYQTIFALGGDPHIARKWPDLYPAGLLDYKAHLQVMGIWLRGDIARAINDSDALPQESEDPAINDEYKLDTNGEMHLLTVNEVMFERLKEHRDREPECPFYSFAYHLYADGDFTDTIDLLLRSGSPIECTYVRCGDKNENCKLAEWLFVTHLVLREIERGL